MDILLFFIGICFLSKLFGGGKKKKSYRRRKKLWYDTSYNDYENYRW